MEGIKYPLGMYDTNPLVASWSPTRILFSVVFLVLSGIYIFKSSDWIDTDLTFYLFVNHREFYDKYFETCEAVFNIFMFYGIFRSIIYLWGWRRINYCVTTVDKKNPGQYQNIRRLLEFRESYMGTQGNDKNSKLYMETGWLDGMLSNPQGENTQRTLRYLDGMLGTMGNKEGLDYLKRMDK